MGPLDKFTNEKPSGCLYHYTGVSGLLGIIKNHTLWATDYRHLNDRKEYRIGERLLREELRARRIDEIHRKAFETLVAQIQKGCYVLSFSENGDQLSQWRAYCPGGNGYALGFQQTNALFASAKQHRFNLVRCVYNLREQKTLCKYLVNSYIEGVITNKSWHAGKGWESRAEAFFTRYQWHFALGLVMAALKHSGFEEEREWRLVSQYPEESMYGVAFRAGRFGVTPYFELPLNVAKPRCPEDQRPQEDETRQEEPLYTIDEIIIGPTSNRAASRPALDLLLSKNCTGALQIKTSRTPLRL